MHDGRASANIRVMSRLADDPVVTLESGVAWEAWLAANHSSATAVWIKMAKKASGIASVTNSEALDGALCYGWIDGIRRRFDDESYLQRYTPRRKRSNWSRINRRRAEQLIEAGRMQPAGLAEIERARADGRWDAAISHPGPSKDN